MKTKKSVETHHAIIQAAESLFMENKVSKVTVNDIVKKAGIAKGTFYFHFDSKDALVWHFIDHQLGYADKWIREIGRYGYEEKDLDKMVDFLIRFIKRHMNQLKMMHNVRFYEFLGLKNMEDRYVSHWYKAVHKWLAQGKKSGQLDIDDPEFMAYYLVISVHEVIDRTILGDLPYTIDQVGDRMKFILTKLLKP